MTPTLKKAFFDETNGMVRAYGNRLDMAKALNAITPGAYHDAKLTGRIRNKFAHNLDVDSFEHEKVRDLVDALDKDGKLEQSYAVGATTDEIIEWGRTEKFIKIALGVCMQILHLHIKEYPFSFSNGPHAIGTGAKPALLDTLNKPPHRGK